MLTELSIENFAIIDRLLLRFEPGFTALTGETGAGKSIIIDALQAALGARAGADLVRTGARMAAVEAVFDWPESGSSPLASLLEENGVEDEGCIILRREINESGRTSARLNGRAVPLSILGGVGTMLVDIHGQSDHLSILRRDRQLDALDRYGNLLPLRDEVSAAVRDYVALQCELEQLSSGQREAEQRLDLLRFQVQEIESANLRADEEEELAAERNLLANAERLTQLSATARDALQGERGAVDGLIEAAAAARDLAAIDPALGALSERLQSAQFELEDIGQELRRYADAVEYDPRRLDAIEERLDLLMRLKRKYGPAVEDVLAFGARAREELDLVENLDERLEELSGRVHAAGERAGSLAVELSLARREAALRLNDAMGEALQGLGLKGTSFGAEVTQVEDEQGLPATDDGARYSFSPSGIDTVAFLVSFNPGEPLRPLERVASGGETSRFLLALKSVLAGADGIPTLIFDEVDVGVGGRSGMVVGERLRRLARLHQVISITHLPQVAALADHHVTVAKKVAGGRTSVAVRELENGDRIAELAEMMSGTETEAARRNAEELLEAAQRGR